MQFGLRLDNTGTTDWLPIGIKYLNHVHSRGVKGNGTVRDIVRRDFERLKLGCFLVHVDDEHQLKNAVREIDLATVQRRYVEH